MNRWPVLLVLAALAAGCDSKPDRSERVAERERRRATRQARPERVVIVAYPSAAGCALVAGPSRVEVRPGQGLVWEALNRCPAAVEVEVGDFKLGDQAVDPVVAEGRSVKVAPQGEGEIAMKVKGPEEVADGVYSTGVGFVGQPRVPGPEIEVR